VLAEKNDAKGKAEVAGRADVIGGQWRRANGRTVADILVVVITNGQKWQETYSQA
jgi:hypothetical protein